MALITTVAELQPYVPMLAEFDMVVISPYIRAVERDTLKKIISPAQLASLQALYDASIAETPTPLNTIQAGLLDRCRVVVANLAAYKAIPVLGVNVSQNGIRINSTDTVKQAFEWQVEDLKSTYLAEGYNGIDDLLEYMEANAATFTGWAASSAYTEFKTSIIKNVATFNKYVEINQSRFLFTKLRTFLTRADITIRKTLYKELYDELKAELLADAVSDANALLLEFIEPAVAYLSFAEAIPGLGLLIDEKGIHQYSTENSQTVRVLKPAEKAFISNQIELYKSLGNSYLKDLTDFLAENLTDYPLYATYVTIDDSSTFKNEEGNGYAYM